MYDALLGQKPPPTKGEPLYKVALGHHCLPMSRYLQKGNACLPKTGMDHPCLPQSRHLRKEPWTTNDCPKADTLLGQDLLPASFFVHGKSRAPLFFKQSCWPEPKSIRLARRLRRRARRGAASSTHSLATVKALCFCAQSTLCITVSCQVRGTQQPLGNLQGNSLFESVFS